MQITPFNFKENQVRTLLLDEKPWFIGKDIAESLGYKNTRDAIATHVHEEDKRSTVVKHDTASGSSKATIINESGMYALVFGSKLEAAKEFKRWVTSEVLPAIRKTGKYEAQKPYQLTIVDLEKADALIERHGGHDAYSRQLIRDRALNIVGESTKLLGDPEFKTVAALYPHRKDISKIGKKAAKLARQNGIELSTVVKYVNGEQRRVKCYSRGQEWVVHHAVEIIDGSLKNTG